MTKTKTSDHYTTPKAEPGRILLMKNSIYFVVFLVFISCQSVDKIAEPKIVIEEDRMVEILTDIAFVKAAKSSNRKVFEEKKINPEAYILKKYGIDSIVFAENNAWYSGQLEKYEAIFIRVKANLDKEKIKYEKLKKEEDSIKKVEDSIKKIKDSLDLKEELITPEAAIEKEIEEAREKRLRSPSKKE